jgi:hypothetical protein
MNQPAIVLTLAIAASREAGVKDADVDRVIATSSQFLRWYVNKGAIPYGDHEPWPAPIAMAVTVLVKPLDT